MSSNPDGLFWRRFAVRICMGFVGLLTVAVVAAFFVFRYGLRRSLERELDEVLEGSVSEFVYHLSSPQWSESLLREDLSHEVAGRAEHGLFFRLYGAAGEELWTVPPSLSGYCVAAPQVIRSALRGHRRHLRHTQAGQPDTISILCPLRQADGSWRVCQTGMSTRQIQERTAKYTYVFGGAGAAVVAAGGLVSFLLTRLPLRRLRTIVAEVRDITAKDLHRRLPLSGAGDEFDELSATLNAMLERLQTAMTGLERFAGDAAHELRGPVARLRMAAEMAARSDPCSANSSVALADILDHADRLTALIDDLLFLVRQDAGVPAGCAETLDAPSLLAETLDLYEAVADEKGVRLLLALPQAGCIRGHRQHLLRALGNLVENAIKFTDAGGRVELGGRAEGTVYHFTVSDTGHGIAPEHLPHVFDRFYRADVARSDQRGTGLGLSIVQAIARAHGGSVTVSSSPGRGSIFTLTIPCHADDIGPAHPPR